MSDVANDGDELSRLIETARGAAEAGGEVIRPVFRPGRLQQSVGKANSTSYDLVTETDTAAERAVVAAITDAFPEHAILGEEAEGDRRTVDDPAEEPHLWIVDPIDGTNNFAHGIPHFAVSVACYRFGRPAVGVVLNPARGDRYEAVAGGGASLNGEAIAVDEAGSLDRCLVGCGFYYDRGAMMRATLAAVEDCFSRDIHGIRRMGTASLDLCQVACGMYGAFFEYQLSPWDFAAARLVVEEAGGRVTTARGDELPLAKTSLLASNTLLHADMLAITGKHHP